MVDLLYLIYLFRHLVTPPYYLRRFWKLPRGAYSSRWNRVNRRLKFPFCNCNSGVLEGIKLWCGTKSNPSSKSYQTTEKWLAKCPQAPPYSNTPVIHFEFFYRRESGNCRICWSADAKEDVGVTGKTNGKAVTKVSFGWLNSAYFIPVNTYRVTFKEWTPLTYYTILEG